MIVQDDGVPVIRVRPRSFLDPGNVVPPGSLDRTTSGVAQVQSYLLFPPYGNQAGRFGGDVLPDPVTNGPYVGSRSPFDPVDFNGPINVHQLSVGAPHRLKAVERRPLPFVGRRASPAPTTAAILKGRKPSQLFLDGGFMGSGLRCAAPEVGASGPSPPHAPAASSPTIASPISPVHDRVERRAPRCPWCGPPRRARR